MLSQAEQPLDQTYDLAALDLDGVVYVGDRAVPGAVAALEQAREHGMRLAFITNNAARPPGVVAAHLRGLGVSAQDSDVVTSAQAAARLLAEQIPPRSRVFVIGGPGLHDALDERGLVAVTSPDDDPVAVIQGYGPDMPWRQLIAGAILVKEGLPWVASNTDLTVPTSRGPGPGNGTLVELVARFADRQPEVAGKPARALFDETRARTGGDRPLVVGDRLDTDIDGARNVGWDSLLVMTGVTGILDLAGLDARSRPTYIGADLGCLALPAPLPVVEGSGHRCGGWVGFVEDDRLVVSGDGDPHAWWRAAAAALWAHLDTAGRAADPGDAVPPR